MGWGPILPGARAAPPGPCGFSWSGVPGGGGSHQEGGAQPGEAFGATRSSSPARRRAKHVRQLSEWLGQGLAYMLRRWLASVPLCVSQATAGRRRRETHTDHHSLEIVSSSAHPVPALQILDTIASRCSLSLWVGVRSTPIHTGVVLETVAWRPSRPYRQPPPFRWQKHRQWRSHRRRRRSSSPFHHRDHHIITKSVSP